MITVQKNQNTGRKTYLMANLPIISPRGAALGLNPGLCSTRPAADCLSHGQSMEMALRYHLCYYYFNIILLKIPETRKGIKEHKHTDNK